MSPAKRAHNSLVRWAQDAQPLGIATVERFASDQCSFYRLANANIVGYEHPYRVELERHYEGHELAGARPYRETAEPAKRPRTAV